MSISKMSADVCPLNVGIPMIYVTVITVLQCISVVSPVNRAVFLELPKELITNSSRNKYHQGNSFGFSITDDNIR